MSYLPLECRVADGVDSRLAQKREKGGRRMDDSETLKAKSVESPDESRIFDNGKLDIVHVDEVTAGRFTLEPGWRWSENVKPLVGTDSCQVLHTGYVVSGQMHVVHEDGTEAEVGPVTSTSSVRGMTPGSWARRPTLEWTSRARRSVTPRRDKIEAINSGAK